MYISILAPGFLSLLRNLAVPSLRPRYDKARPAIGCLVLALQVGRDLGYLQRGSGRNGETIRFDPVPHEFVTWSMPAHYLRRPEDKKRGFIRAPSGSIIYTICPDHPEHHLKGKRRRF
ncbi:MAG: hypothetical protein IKM91_06530 [Candidatus Methanomethylophilaceae archaeon]|nr:hypothetical protein [Candidatus Methanomethylophilaceae archaeon]